MSPHPVLSAFLSALLPADRAGFVPLPSGAAFRRSCSSPVQAAELARFAREKGVPVAVVCSSVRSSGRCWSVTIGFSLAASLRLSLQLWPESTTFRVWSASFSGLLRLQPGQRPRFWCPPVFVPRRWAGWRRFGRGRRALGLAGLLAAVNVPAAPAASSSGSARLSLPSVGSLVESAKQAGARPVVRPVSRQLSPSGFAVVARRAFPLPLSAEGAPPQQVGRFFVVPCDGVAGVGLSVVARSYRVPVCLHPLP